MSITRYVKISINRNRASLPADQFGAGMLVYQVSQTVQPKRFLEYSSPQEVSESTLPQRVKDALNAFFEQANHPQSVLLGRRNPGTAQVSTVTVTTADAGTWTFDINGAAVSYIATGTSTAQQIAEGLVVQARALGEDIAVSDAVAGVFTLTAGVPGVSFVADGFTAPGTGVGAIAATTASVAGEDWSDCLDAIETAGAEFYGLCIEDRGEAAIKEASAWVESRRKIFIAQTNDTDLRDGNASNLAEDLEALSRKRTHVTYNRDDAEFSDVALLAQGLSFDLDSRKGTWEFSPLAGVTPSNTGDQRLSQGQMNNIVAGPASVFLRAGGRNIIEGSRLANGLYIDQVVTEDWTASRIEQAVFDVLSGDRHGALFTLDGTAKIEGALRSVGAIAVQAEHYVPGSVQVSIPNPADLTPAQRQSRCLDNVIFTYTEAQYLHKVKVTANIEG